MNEIIAHLSELDMPGAPFGDIWPGCRVKVTAAAAWPHDPTPPGTWGIASGNGRFLVVEMIVYQPAGGAYLVYTYDPTGANVAIFDAHAATVRELRQVGKLVKALRLGAGPGPGNPAYRRDPELDAAAARIAAGANYREELAWLVEAGHDEIYARRGLLYRGVAVKS
jgi:hypothetical protein